MANLHDAAWHCLMCPCPSDKVAYVRRIQDAWTQARAPGESLIAPVPVLVPGRPAKPTLVAPRDLVRRRLGSTKGRAALIHAIVHIEFNAINLALDAVYRFRDLPDAFYRDWLRVAAEEARHFEMLEARLGQTGYRYGDFPAHDGLWEVAVKTADDVLLRMALVPRVLEARGLDVTPGMIRRLQGVGDDQTADILSIILSEEIDHVAIGTHWFRSICAQRGLDSETTFSRLLTRHMPVAAHGPLNTEARLQAGFTANELEILTSGP